MPLPAMLFKVLAGCVLSIWMLPLMGWFWKLKWRTDSQWLGKWHMAMTELLSFGAQTISAYPPHSQAPLHLSKALPYQAWFYKEAELCGWGQKSRPQHGQWQGRRLDLHQGLDRGNSHHLLWCHLGDQLEGGEAGGEEAVPVLNHFDGTEPVIHGGKGREVWDGAVEQGLGRPMRQRGAGDPQQWSCIESCTSGGWQTSQKAASLSGWRFWWSPELTPSSLQNIELAAGMATQVQVAHPPASGCCHASVSSDRGTDQRAVWMEGKAHNSLVNWNLRASSSKHIVFYNIYVQFATTFPNLLVTFIFLVLSWANWNKWNREAHHWFLAHSWSRHQVLSWNQGAILMFSPSAPCPILHQVIKIWPPKLLELIHFFLHR